MKKIKCDVCGFKMLPQKELLYEARETLWFAEALTSCTKTFEAMDCPRCGHQVVFGVRMARVQALVRME